MKSVRILFLSGFLIGHFTAGHFMAGHSMARSLFAQESVSVKTGQLSVEDNILLQQIFAAKDQRTSSQKLNERMQALARPPGRSSDYRLGPGDVIELSVAAIPELSQREFTLDGLGRVSVPYLGQIDLLGLTARRVESKLAKLFGASLLEDPQVSVRIKEYKSQYYYVMGYVFRPGKYQLTQETDILDALALAGGLKEKADSRIRIHRFSQRSLPMPPLADDGVAISGVENTGGSASSQTIEIDLNELLAEGGDINRMAIYSGDVIRIEERKDKNYFVLGDIRNPGAFPIPSDEPAVLSQALGNAGGLLNTASGKKTKIIRYKKSGELPELIEVNAYALLNGDVKDIELRANDIVIVPGSFSKSLGKTFLSGVSGVLTTLLILGIP
jgi:polysaccharide export outer membrane protein